MKNIILIEPQSTEDHVYKHVHMPRLGLPLLGTQLTAEGFAVSIYLGHGSSLPWSKILGADLVGISTTTSTSREAYRIAGYIRSFSIPVIIGGIHATFLPDEALQFADYVVRGEADTVFVTLAKALEAGSALEQVPGVSYWRDGQTIHNPCPTEWVDIKQLPIPNLKLFSDYNKLRSIPVMTSRGCPYNCTFCSVTKMFGHRYRFRDTANVLEELSCYGNRQVFFCDDNFTADRRRSRDLLQGMLEQRPGLRGWGAQVRVELARDQEIMELMRRSRCNILYVGLESINPATLESYGKNQCVEDIKEFIQRCHEHRIRVHGMFVFGSDQDSVATIRDTVDFALENRIDSVQFLILTPLPGTPLFHQLENEGRILTKDWELYDGHHVVYQPNLMSPQQLQEETIQAFKRFYSLHNLFQNVTLTGLGTSIYRGLGWWLVRHFEKRNRWYDQILKKMQGNIERPVPVFYRRLVPLTLPAMPSSSDVPENPLRIFVSESKGILYFRLRGLISSFPHKELNDIIRSIIPKRHFHVVVNTESLSLASEKEAQSLTCFLNKLGERVRRLQVVSRKDAGVLCFKGKYLLRLPRFELLLNRYFRTQ